MGEQKRRRDFYGQAPHQRLGDRPVEQQYHDQMIEVVKLVDTLFNGEATGDARETGFVLMVFPFGNVNGRCNYMSNGADRRDVVVLMKEMIARFEGQAQITGKA